MMDIAEQLGRPKERVRGPMIPPLNLANVVMVLTPGGRPGGMGKVDWMMICGRHDIRPLSDAEVQQLKISELGRLSAKLLNLRDGFKS